jgi:hypothetical protein
MYHTHRIFCCLNPSVAFRCCPKPKHPPEQCCQLCGCHGLLARALRHQANTVTCLQGRASARRPARAQHNTRLYKMLLLLLTRARVIVAALVSQAAVHLLHKGGAGGQVLSGGSFENRVWATKPTLSPASKDVPAPGALQEHNSTTILVV